MLLIREYIGIFLILGGKLTLYMNRTTSLAQKSHVYIILLELIWLLTTVILNSNRRKLEENWFLPVYWNSKVILEHTRIRVSSILAAVNLQVMGIHYWFLLHLTRRNLLNRRWPRLFGLELVHLSIEGLKFINWGLRCLSKECCVVLCGNTESWLFTKQWSSSCLRETIYLLDNSWSWFNNIHYTLYLKRAIIPLDSNSAMNGNVLDQVESMHPWSLESWGRYQLLVEVMVRNPS